LSLNLMPSPALTPSPSDSLGSVPPGSVFLITGSNGFLGTRVVESLLERGCRNLRCFVRPSSRLDRLKATLSRWNAGTSTELVAGDLLSREDCARAAQDASIIFHLAAGFDKSFAGAFMNSALATRNLLEAFLERGKPQRFVNVSSFAVYSNFRLGRGAVLDESSPLEEAFQERGDAYGFGKLRQEQMVRDCGAKRSLPFVILRPGTVYGSGKRDLTGRIGIDTFGFLIHIGGGNRLPLTHVKNCAEAVVLAGLVPGVEGETFNVVDDEISTSRRFLRAYKKKTGRWFSVRLPYRAAYFLCWLWERYSVWSKGQLPPAFNRRRCAGDWKGNRFPNQKIKARLGWKPRVSLREGMADFLGQFDETHA
jgi:nucleoside-diphosphate-sugar epimerase